MTNKEFEVFLMHALHDINKTLGKKAGEYAINDNRFHNFYEAVKHFHNVGEIDTPAKAAYAFMVKHLVSVTDLLNNKEKSKELIDEKVGDLIIYALLIKGMLYDEVDNV